MIATADGYCDFLRMLMNYGYLNHKQFLNPKTVKEITSPQTQLENNWGYNGYNLWVTSDTLRKLGVGDSGLWQGGGYEGTEFWIDSKRGFVGVKMSQFVIQSANLSVQVKLRHSPTVLSVSPIILVVPGSSRIAEGLSIRAVNSINDIGTITNGWIGISITLPDR